MSRGFSLSDLLNAESMKQAVRSGHEERFCIDDIVDNKDNFFNTDTNLGGLKDDILANGVTNPVQLERKEVDGEVTYVLIEGHRRVLSCRQLVEEGHEEFRHVSAIIKEWAGSTKEVERLITSNTTQRQISAWEMFMSASMLREVYENAGETGVRDKVAKKLHLSTGQTSKYFYIGEHLIDGLMGVFKAGDVAMNLIHDAAHLTESEQGELEDIVKVKGTFAKEDIDEIESRRVIPGQQLLMENADNKDIVSYVEKYNNSVSDSEDNLSPSDKSEEEETVEEYLSPSDKLEEETLVEGNLSLSDKNAPKEMVNEDLSPSDKNKYVEEAWKNLSPSDKLEEEETAEDNLSPSDKTENETAVEEDLSLSDKSNSLKLGTDSKELESSESTIESKFPMTGTFYAEGAYSIDTVDELMKKYEGFLKKHISDKIDKDSKCILDALELLWKTIKECQ